MRGDAGNDRIYGESGADQLFGGDGSDVLEPGPSSDVIYGDAGDDKVTATDGTPDYVNCGTGGADKAIVDAFDTVVGCETRILQ